MKKFAIVLASVVVAAGNFAHAGAGAATGSSGPLNLLVINISTVVNQHCNLDFDSGSGVSQVVTKTPTLSDDKIFASDRAGVQAEIKLMDDIAVYETCNDNFKLTLTSANGGLALGGDPSKTLVPYSISYLAVGFSVDKQPTSSLALGHDMHRTLASFQGVVGNANKGLNHSPASLSFAVVPQKGIPVGAYSDLVSLQMSAE